jgi:hypothetical protein
MKKILSALILVIWLIPITAWGQKWIEPYTDKDGTQVEGHWQTPDDLRQKQYSTPGQVNPYTGQFNPYSSPKGFQPAAPAPQLPPPWDRNPYYPQRDYK